MDNYNGNRGGNYYNNSGYGNPNGSSGYPGASRNPMPMSNRTMNQTNAGGTDYRARYGGGMQEEPDMEGFDLGEPEDNRLVIKRRIFLGIKIFAAVCLVAMIVVGVVLWNKYGNMIVGCYNEAQDIIAKSTPADFKPEGSSTFFDCNGKEIEGWKTNSAEYYLTSDEIPQLVKDTFVVSEDKDFANHKGISYKGMLRAVVAIIQNGGQLAQGGSTITQQLTRNIYLSFEKSMERKFKEIFISLELEKQYEKEEILEFYINNIYFMNGYYGIESAAQGYFGKSVNELSAAQIVYICAIPNNPSLYDPYENPDKTEARKKRLLDQLYADKKIEQSVYNQATAEAVTVGTNTSESVAISNSLKSYVEYSATRALMEAAGFEFQYGFTKAQEDELEIYDAEYKERYNEMNTRLFNTNYKVYTSIDLNAQEALQTAIDEELADQTELKSDGVYNFQGAAVSIDNNTGKVVAIVGNRTQEGVLTSLNRAFKAYRQPGSAIKPILVYGPAFDLRDEEDYALYHLNSKMMDEPITGMDELNPPKNANGKYDNAEVTFQNAIERSLNTIPWLLLKDIKPSYALKYLKKMNFNKITSDDSNLSSALGGVNYGASPLEMCAAYATIANEGLYRAPSCITKVENDEGETIAQNRTGVVEVYDINTTKQLTQAMQGVLVTGTAKGYGVEGMDSAAKTGTTSKKVDGWICGYTPYYTTAVWVGNDDNKSCDALSGATYPAKVWKRYMDTVNSGLSYKQFDTTTVGLKTRSEQKTIEEIYAEFGLDERYGDPYDPENPYFIDGVYTGKTLEPEVTEPPEGWIEDPNNPGQFIDPESLRTEEPEPTNEPDENKKTEKPKKTKDPNSSENPEESANPEESMDPSMTTGPDSSATPSPDNEATAEPEEGGIFDNILPW